MGWRDKVSGAAALEEIMADKDGEKAPAGPKPVAQGSRIVMPGQVRGPAGAARAPVDPRTAAWLQGQQKALLLIPAGRLEVGGQGRALTLPVAMAEALLRVHAHLLGGGGIQLIDRQPGVQAKPDCAAGQQQLPEAMVGGVPGNGGEPAGAVGP